MGVLPLPLSFHFPLPLGSRTLFQFQFLIKRIVPPEVGFIHLNLQEDVAFIVSFSNASLLFHFFKCPIIASILPKKSVQKFFLGHGPVGPGAATFCITFNYSGF